MFYAVPWLLSMFDYLIDLIELNWLLYSEWWAEACWLWLGSCIWNSSPLLLSWGIPLLIQLMHVVLLYNLLYIHMYFVVFFCSWWFNWIVMNAVRQY